MGSRVWSTSTEYRPKRRAHGRYAYTLSLFRRAAAPNHTCMKTTKAQYT